MVGNNINQISFLLTDYPFLYVFFQRLPMHKINQTPGGKFKVKE